jgi:hypothetical protein
MDLQAPVVQVAHPSSDPELDRVALRRISEPHALHPAAYDRA